VSIDDANFGQVMTSEVEQRPRLITAGYGRQGSQWVKIEFKEELMLVRAS